MELVSYEAGSIKMRLTAIIGDQYFNVTAMWRGTKFGVTTTD